MDTTTPAQGTPPLWTSKQLLMEAETIVVGRFGIPAVYAVLKMICDEYDADRQRLVTELAESQAYALTLERALGEAVPDVVLEGIGYMASTYWLAHTGPNDTYRLVTKWVNGQRRTSSSPTAGE